MEIKYKIDRAKRKNIYICIKDGEVIVKGPKLMSDARAEKVVKEKEKWILKKSIILTIIIQIIIPFQYPSAKKQMKN